MRARNWIVSALATGLTVFSAVHAHKKHIEHRAVHHAIDEHISGSYRRLTKKHQDSVNRVVKLIIPKRGRKSVGKMVHYVLQYRDALMYASQRDEVHASDMGMVVAMPSYRSSHLVIAMMKQGILTQSEYSVPGQDERSREGAHYVRRPRAKQMLDRISRSRVRSTASYLAFLRDDVAYNMYY